MRRRAAGGLSVAAALSYVVISRALSSARVTPGDWQKLDFASNLVSNLNSWARELTLALCDGVTWVYQYVLYTLRKVASDLKAKTDYLWRAPWLMVECLDPTVAAWTVDQLRSLPCVCEPLLKRYRDERLSRLEAARFSRLVGTEM